MNPRSPEQGIDTAPEVTGRFDRDLHQAVGRAVHQPPPAPAIAEARQLAALKSAETIGPMSARPTPT
jgi:hypothetical protein